MYEGNHAAPLENQPNVCLLRYTWKEAMTDPKNVETKDCEKHLTATANVNILWKWSTDLQALNGRSAQNMLPSITEMRTVLRWIPSLVLHLA